MPRPYLLAPSILAADFTRLGEDVRAVLDAGAHWIHVDVMDGQFVPNISMGPLAAQAVRSITDRPVDVHLMIERPELHIDAFARAGASLLSVHIEGSAHIHRTLQAIRSLGCQAGIVLNPGTPAAALSEVIDMVDLVLVMSVNPGFGGQAFLPSSLAKIRQVRAMLDQAGSAAHLEVDGGVSAGNLPALIEAGANVFVAGTSVFKDPAGIAAGVQRLTGLFPA